MKKLRISIVLAAITLLLSAVLAYGHCEIPCGIYDDDARITLLREHIATLEKSMSQILDLQKDKTINHNQLTRWIVNKEDHANQFQHIVSQYFMTQRIKTDTKKYTEKVTTLHKMLVYAMKCKQTTDLAHIKTLTALVAQFEKLYFGK